MTLCGIETGADCEKKMDELLVMVDIAEDALKADAATAKHAIRALKARLQELFRKGTQGQ